MWLKWWRRWTSHEKQAVSSWTIWPWTQCLICSGQWIFTDSVGTLEWSNVCLCLGEARRKTNTLKTSYLVDDPDLQPSSLSGGCGFWSCSSSWSVWVPGQVVAGEAGASFPPGCDHSGPASFSCCWPQLSAAACGRSVDSRLFSPLPVVTSGPALHIRDHKPHMLNHMWSHDLQSVHL